ncbi:MAG: methylated-DNA--[protein]-cysteine S-methyltransferase [Planctomycetia bacterium]|nr:methylated-DNA--[protein]-cysteine S-methyltransferase [Planctomycetia bacterium]
MIYYTQIKTQIGNLGLVRDDDSLLRIYLPNENISEQILQKIYPNENIHENKSGFENVINQLTEYFDGKRKHFTIKTKIKISQFYKKSLAEVAKVPYGETTSYSQIAKKLNNPKAARAVGSANARNPLPIIIPCHRIVANNGQLGGYGGGIKMKKYLLKFEKENLNTH